MARKPKKQVPVKMRQWIFVEVEWVDAKSDATWCGHDELPNTARILTRGWLVRETDRCLTLAASVDMDESQRQVGEVITIPKGCVEIMRELGVL